MIETMEQPRSSPFAHCMFSDVFTDAVALGLSQRLADWDGWSDRNEPHYRTRTCHWRPENLPPTMATLLTRNVMGGLTARMQKVFAEKFAAKFWVSANKQEAGDGSMVHNDYFEDIDHPFFFTHRLIVYLSEDSAVRRGGLLGLFASENSSDLSHIIEPRFNTGVGMAMGPNSFHAVSMIDEGVRYSLCFSFTNADHRYHL